VENVEECVNTISFIYNHHFSKSSKQLKNYQENERKIIFGLAGGQASPAGTANAANSAHGRYHKTFYSRNLH
jgi:hypothetical protein